MRKILNGMLFGLFVGLLGILSLESFASDAPPAHPTKETAAKEKASDHADETPEKKAIPVLEKPGCEVLPQKKLTDLWEVSQCHYKKGNLEKAIDVLREISRRDTHDLDAYFTSSWLLWTMAQSKSGDLEAKFQEEAVDELNRAVELNPTHWEAYVERGDFFFLRSNQITKAYAEYTKARTLYDGDFARKVMPAEAGRKAAIEARIARTAERLDRKGEAVEASCRALFFDPDDKGSKERVERLFGSCLRKKVKDPRKTEESHD